MSGLTTCATCGCHVRVGTCACPHCGSTACSAYASPRAGAALVLGLALAGCRLDLGGKDDTFRAEPAYGIAIIDEDGDGWEEEVDCDDTDPEVHPEAEEIPGDGVDQNCDGDDDT